MRIVIKPGGAVLLGLAFVGFTYSTLTSLQSGKPVAPKQTTGYTFGQKTIVASPGAITNTEILLNGDFEGAFIPSVPDASPAVGHISGTNGIRWHDNSAWGDATVVYAADNNNPHGGKSCQRMTLINKKGIAQGQFAQTISVVEPGNLQGSVWLRAEKPVNVTFVLRDALKFDVSYVYKDVTLSTQWQKLEINWTANQKANVLFMVILKAPGTIWIDDASLKMSQQPALSNR